MRRLGFILVLLALAVAAIFVLSSSDRHPEVTVARFNGSSTSAEQPAARTSAERPTSSRSIPLATMAAPHPARKVVPARSTPIPPPDSFPPDSVDPSSPPSRPPSATELLAATEGAMPVNAALYKAMDGSIALSVKNGNYVLALANGSLLRFTDSGEGLKLRTSAGTECSLVASASGYLVGHLTQESYLVVTPDGQEITLTSPQAAHTAFAPFDSPPEATSTIEALYGLKRDSREGHELYATPDKQYVLTAENSTYRLISSSGSSPEFRQADENLAVQLPSGTTCKFVAGNEVLSVGQLTPDSFVVLTKDGEEKTLGFIAYADQYDVSINDQGLASLVYTGLDTKPDWWLSMAERRVLRRMRYVKSTP